jgi:hypothetical protein
MLILVGVRLRIMQDDIYHGYYVSKGATIMIIITDGRLSSISLII